LRDSLFFENPELTEFTGIRDMRTTAEFYGKTLIKFWIFGGGILWTY
jgi:hypothetical protein